MTYSSTHTILEIMDKSTHTDAIEYHTESLDLYTSLTLSHSDLRSARMRSMSGGCE